jgi:estrogen-related receptor beta like 1
MIEPTVDAQVWRAEVDRVAPKLAAAPSGLIAGSSKGGGGGVGGVQKGEWRAHLEQSTHSNAIVASLLPTSKGSLERLSEDLSQLLEVVRGREKSINTTFKHLMVEHKACAEKTAESQLAVQAVQATVNKFSAELAAISDVLEEVKQNIEEKGNSVTDTSPLIKVKAALSSIRSECRSLDLQIGVVSHAVLQARITHKRSGPLSTEDDVGLNNVN